MTLLRSCRAAEQHLYLDPERVRKLGATVCSPIDLPRVSAVLHIASDCLLAHHKAPEEVATSTPAWFILVRLAYDCDSPKSMSHCAVAHRIMYSSIHFLQLQRQLGRQFTISSAPPRPEPQVIPHARPGSAGFVLRLGTSVAALDWRMLARYLLSPDLLCCRTALVRLQIQPLCRCLAGQTCCRFPTTEWLAGFCRL